MIYISRDECINPELIESMIFHNEGIHIFMASGRMLQVIDDVGRIIKEISEYWDMKSPKVAEIKPKRKYTKRKKDTDGPDYNKDVESLGGE